MLPKNELTQILLALLKAQIIQSRCCSRFVLQPHICIRLFVHPEAKSHHRWVPRELNFECWRPALMIMK